MKKFQVVGIGNAMVDVLTQETEAFLTEAESILLKTTSKIFLSRSLIETMHSLF